MHSSPTTTQAFNMNPLRPIGHLAKAVTFPFTALFVVGLCAFINW